MRHYLPNSANAAGRILALAMVVDGNLAPVELKALERTRLLDHIDIDADAFHALLEELCLDLLSTSVRQESVELSPAAIDSLLADITAPELRRQLLRAIWSIAEADGVLADGEATLLARACAQWSAESRFVGTPGH